MILGRSWAALGQLLGALGHSWGTLGAPGGSSGLSFGRLGAPFLPKKHPPGHPDVTFLTSGCPGVVVGAPFGSFVLHFGRFGFHLGHLSEPIWGPFWDTFWDELSGDFFFRTIFRI